MINPRISPPPKHVLEAVNTCVVYTPDFSGENVMYRDFGQNSEIDIMRNNPRYENIVNSRLREVSDTSIDMSSLSDEQMADNMPSRLYDDNEVTEFLLNHKDK